MSAEPTLAEPTPAESTPAELTAAERTAAAVGPWATAGEAFALLTVDVPVEHWIESLTIARDTLGLTFFDWLSAVDELADGFSVAVHLASVGNPAEGVRRVLFRTRIPRDAASLPSATGLFAGAGWHERETHEMFGIDFTGHPHLSPLLLPDGFEGHPLRKEFVLAARVAKAWPGAKEPGESDHAPAGAAPAARRRMLPPGVPDPNEWGPLAGTLPPVPERPARGAARGPRAATAATPPGEGPAVRADRPRRNRSVDQGSASQAAPAGTPAPDAASTSDAPVPGLPAPDAPSATPPPSVPPTPAPPTPAPPTPDAPWHLPRPEATPPPPPAPPATGDDA
ncbi:NADH-quinone oxidoreductase subunit C [Streptacidiphilus sp. N1-3]|uniref:NADH-quinone oxidoreductase subunit C n=1 Tax=Streptacidiphilus alkalitolerans TaxID=3342712 RepID=A0ABV6X440_9ACTN